MPLLKTIKLCNLSHVHIGTGRESYDTSAGELHSDTLSAALAAVGVSTGKCTDVLSFLSKLRISSAFPYWGDFFFLPKLQGRLNASVDGLHEHEYRKRLKAVKYIEASLWRQLANGEALCLKSEQVQGRFIIPSDAKIGDICKSQVSQRVSVPRDGVSNAEPFFFDWHYYDSHAGLYCLVDADETLMKTIVDLFKVLGDNGIGTDKSVGGGKFDVELGEMNISEPVDADTTMLLSLYIPTEEEFQSLLCGSPRYNILRRGGFMAGSSVEKFRHLRKKTVYAFGVGSMFHTTKELEGKVVNVTPEWKDQDMHSVYRSGKPLSIKIKTNGL